MQSVNAITIRDLGNFLGGRWIHQHLDLDIKQGEICAIVGGSGSGKTTLLRSVLMLNNPVSGSIKVFDTEVINASLNTANSVRKRFGMLFQRSALFSSLTVLQNVMYPLTELTCLPKPMCQELAELKIAMVGLPVHSHNKFPAELSGGMQKRAACARALALDPEILFLDEPSAGLDPIAAESLDKLLLQLRSDLNLTLVLVTHDLDTLWTITDKVAYIGEQQVLAALPMQELIRHDHPEIQQYFGGARARRFLT